MGFAGHCDSTLSPAIASNNAPANPGISPLVTTLVPNRPVTDEDLEQFELEIALCRRCGGFAWVPEDVVHHSQKCVGRRELDAVETIRLVPKTAATED